MFADGGRHGPASRKSTAGRRRARPARGERRLRQGQAGQRARAGASRRGSRPRPCRWSSCPADASAEDARKAGSAIAGFNAGVPLTVLAGGLPRLAEVVLGLNLRVYDFTTYRTPEKDATPPNRAVTLPGRRPRGREAAFAPLPAQADGICFTRDLVCEPANVLYPTEFAERLTAGGPRRRGRGAGRAGARGASAWARCSRVGQGSESQARGDAVEGRRRRRRRCAFVGKGVVFDTGGISIKPAARHGGHEHGHGRRRRRRRRDARARAARPR